MKLMPVGWKRLSIVWAAAWVGFTILYAIVAILERYMKE